jgi:hypothetical protein
VKRIEVHCIYAYEDSLNKPTRHFENGGWRKGGMEIKWRG